jgi:hypothetical protein
MIGILVHNVFLLKLDGSSRSSSLILVIFLKNVRRTAEHRLRWFSLRLDHQPPSRAHRHICCQLDLRLTLVVGSPCPACCIHLLLHPALVCARFGPLCNSLVSCHGGTFVLDIGLAIVAQPAMPAKALESSAVVRSGVGSGIGTRIDDNQECFPPTGCCSCKKGNSSSKSTVASLLLLTTSLSVTPVPTAVFRQHTYHSHDDHLAHLLARIDICWVARLAGNLFSFVFFCLAVAARGFILFGLEVWGCCCIFLPIIGIR